MERLNAALVPNRRILLTFMVVLVSIFFCLWQPIYLAPPLFNYTGVIYGSFVVFWVSILAIQVLRSKRLGCLMKLSLLIMGSTQACTIGYILLSFLMASGDLERKDLCIQESAGENVTRYTCMVGLFVDNPSPATFEGPKNLPFMWLVSRASHESQ